MDDTGTRSGATEEEKQNFDRFLNMLTAAFSGRRCILYEHKTMIPSGTDSSSGAAADITTPVASTIVTLKPSQRELIVGAFVRTSLGTSWEYWEGAFGPSELAAHREGLGWEGHTLETLRNCFVKAVEATLETRDFPPSPNKSKETSASIPKAHKGGATSDEQTQRPPELSRDEGVGGGESNANAGEATRQPADKSPLCSSISSTRATVDLHYADSDLVGSWEVRLVQDGLNDSLVTSMRKSILAASVHASVDGDEDPNASNDHALPNPSEASAGKRRGVAAGRLTQRRRVQAKGATLRGSQPSTET